MSRTSTVRDNLSSSTKHKLDIKDQPDTCIVQVQKSKLNTPSPLRGGHKSSSQSPVCRLGSEIHSRSPIAPRDSMHAISEGLSRQTINCGRHQKTCNRNQQPSHNQALTHIKTGSQFLDQCSVASYERF